MFSRMLYLAVADLFLHILGVGDILYIYIQSMYTSFMICYCTRAQYDKQCDSHPPPPLFFFFLNSFPRSF